MTYSEKTICPRQEDQPQENGCLNQRSGVMATEFSVKMPHADGFQLCPKCDGSGFVNPGFASTSSQDQCPVCLGRMIINKATGLPPNGAPGK